VRGSLTHRYLIALGSNIRSHRHGSPRSVVVAAADALAQECGAPVALSPIIASAPLGPSARLYANACALVESDDSPREMLAICQRIESAFGRRRGGQRWNARVLDLDIVLWSGGIYADEALLVPHPRFPERPFVLGPAATIAPGWRDPLTGRSLAQMKARLTRPRPILR